MTANNHQRGDDISNCRYRRVNIRKASSSVIPHSCTVIAIFEACGDRSIDRLYMLTQRRLQQRMSLSFHGAWYGSRDRAQYVFERGAQGRRATPPPSPPVPLLLLPPEDPKQLAAQIPSITARDAKNLENGNGC